MIDSLVSRIRQRLRSPWSTCGSTTRTRHESFTDVVSPGNQKTVSCQGSIADTSSDYPRSRRLLSSCHSHSNGSGQATVMAQGLNKRDTGGYHPSAYGLAEHHCGVHDRTDARDTFRGRLVSASCGLRYSMRVSVLRCIQDRGSCQDRERPMQLFRGEQGLQSYSPGYFGGGRGLPDSSQPCVRMGIYARKWRNVISPPSSYCIYHPHRSLLGRPLSA